LGSDDDVGDGDVVGPARPNAAFAVENLFIWNVLPPCVATLVALGVNTGGACGIAAPS